MKGIMRGFPVPKAQRVPRADWDRAPWNRWTFQHVREVVPTTEVWRGAGPVWHLPRRQRQLNPTFAGPNGEPVSLEHWLASDYTDGFIVLHRGEVVLERYDNGMHERTLHLSQSVAKSVVGCVAGILVGRGLLDPAVEVAHYLPELKRTAWRGALLRHVLDMTSGVRYDESYEAPDSDIARTDIACGWKPPRRGVRAPACVWDQILGLKAIAWPHGEHFSYRSIETDVLAHCLERVTGTRLAELVSRELWAAAGMEESACFTVDSAGYALACGGLNATLRDYARVGQMLLDSGIANGRQLVPQAWLIDTLAARPGQFIDSHAEIFPHGGYRNQLWIEDLRRRTVMARGVFGQLIYVAPEYDMVMVKLSSWPEFTSVSRSIQYLRAAHALGAALNT